MSPAFAQRERIIPLPVWIAAGFLFTGLTIGFNLMAARHHVAPALHLLITLGALAAAGYTLLVGYVYGDAKRRGMRYVMWTLLAIFLANGIGVILYFVLRDPLPGYCSACGSTMHAGFAYCPRCGANMLPACGSCRRVSQPGWSHCAYCGTKL